MNEPLSDSEAQSSNLPIHSADSNQCTFEFTDQEEAFYQKTLPFFQKTDEESSATNKILFLVGTLVLFAFLSGDQFPLQGIIQLILVLLFHELGHFFGMQIFGYRNVRMFFIPFFGAAVSGTKHAVPVWQQAIVLLLGPMPGIILGLLLTIFLQPPQESWWADLIIMLLVLNGLNLLPFIPLDGGRLVDLLLGSTKPWINTTFYLIAVAFFAFTAWYLQSIVIGILAGVMFLGTPIRLFWSRLRSTYQNNPLGFPRHEALSDTHIRNLYVLARPMLPQTTNPNLVATMMKNIHEYMMAYNPGITARIVWTGIYLSGFVFCVLGIVLTRSQFQAEQIDFLTTEFNHTMQQMDAVQRLTKIVQERAPKLDEKEPNFPKWIDNGIEERWTYLIELWNGYPEPIQHKALEKLRTLYPDRTDTITELEQRLRDKTPF